MTYALRMPHKMGGLVCGSRSWFSASAKLAIGDGARDRAGKGEILSRLRPLTGALAVAGVSALLLAAVAGATHGPADAVNAVHANVSNPGWTKLTCNTNDATISCVDAVQSNATNVSPAVRGAHDSTLGSAPGVYGYTNSTAGNAYGVYGKLNATSAGPSSAAVRGESLGTNFLGIGVWGSNAGPGWGGYFSSGSTGLALRAEGGYFGVAGSSGGGNVADLAGVYGSLDNDAPNAAGVRGHNYSANCCGMGVMGSHSGQGIGVYGESENGFAVSGFSPNNWAGYFHGSMRVVGTLEKSGGSFTIDHPLDPADKYLSHSFVESPDMMNVYNGNAVTNRNGFATVKLPAYFQALNRDFRYQLTPIGQFAQAMVATEIANNRFTIRTNKPNVKVSWQVTGIRHDRWANAHRIKVEREKKGKEAGKYLTPELYGKSAAKNVVLLPGMKSISAPPRLRKPKP